MTFDEMSVTKGDSVATSMAAEVKGKPPFSC